MVEIDRRCVDGVDEADDEDDDEDDANDEADDDAAAARSSRQDAVFRRENRLGEIMMARCYYYLSWCFFMEMIFS